MIARQLLLNGLYLSFRSRIPACGSQGLVDNQNRLPCLQFRWTLLRFEINPDPGHDESGKNQQPAHNRARFLRHSHGSASNATLQRGSCSASLAPTTRAAKNGRTARAVRISTSDLRVRGSLRCVTNCCGFNSYQRNHNPQKLLVIHRLCSGQQSGRQNDRLSE